MNKVFRRSIIAAILSGALILGTLLFVVEFFIDGRKWATDPRNVHIYTQGVLDSGSIVDRNGDLLFSAVDGVFSFSDSAAVRRATLHTLGDLDGNIATGVLSRYKNDIIGYNVLGGVYRYHDNANTLHLNLDAQLCAIALESLGSRKGTVGVYNYKTGELYCMVSTPTFDIADVPAFSDDDERYEGVYINRFLSGKYVPGSVFKVITAQAALETVPDIFERTFTCTGKLELGGQKIHCSATHGQQDFYDALANSCNCAFAEISQLIGPGTLQKCVEKAGLAKAGSMDGYATASGHFDLSGAGPADVAWAAIGQYTDMINPCAFLRYIGAVANDGMAVNPSLADRLVDAYGMTHSAGKTGNQRLMSKDTARLLQELLRNNVSATYGKSTFGDLSVCAKSGTAQIDGKFPHSVFTGFVQDEELPLAFIVIVENAGSGQGAAMNVAARVLSGAAQNIC